MFGVWCLVFGVWLGLDSLFFVIGLWSLVLGHFLMPSILALLAFSAVVMGLGLWLTQRARMRRVAGERLSTEREERAAAPPASRARRFASRHWLLPWLAAAAVFAMLVYLVGLPWQFAAALAMLVGLMGGQLDIILLARTTDRIEIQLADTIDLMVSSLKVGSTLQGALESSLHELRKPLRPQLDEVVVRWRYGDEPRLLLAALAERVPLESFRLFATSLAVNWEVGGSLVQTLASVGRTIRSRIEIGRRLQSMSMQGRASVAAIMLVTYLIAALMWRNDPDRMSLFLASTAGQWLVSIAIVLQGFGIVWISALSRPRF